MGTATGGQGVLGFSFRVHQGAHSLRDVPIAEVTALDLQIENGQVLAYRAKVKVSFKSEGGD